MVLIFLQSAENSCNDFWSAFMFCLSAANNKSVACDRLPVAGFSRSARHCRSKIFFKFQADVSSHLAVILVVGWISEVLPLRGGSCSFGLFLFSICTFLFLFFFSWTTRIQAFGPNTVSSTRFLYLRRSSLYPLLCFLQDSSTKSLSSRLDEYVFISTEVRTHCDMRFLED